MAGGYVAARMPVDVLPDVTAPTVTVLVEGHGLAPGDMEALVTFPIEAALNGAAEVRRVRSATAVGIAVIWVDFDWSADVYRARQTVVEKLAGVAATLPEGIEPPVLAPLTSIMGEIMFVALAPEPAAGAPPPSALDLRTTAEVLVRRRLLATPGVSQVTVIGGERRQFEVLVDPGRLANYGVALGAVEETLRRASRNTSAGFRLAGGQEYLIQGAGRVRDIEGIGATVITTRDTRPIRVRDVAELRIGESLKRGDGSRNGRPAVILGIHRQPDVNTLALTRELETVLDGLQAELPAGMELDPRLFRQADFIALALENLNAALRDGTLLVILVTLVFLANLRAGAITLVAIPLSLLAAVAGLRAAGMSINSMTLGGFVIAVGALVDDAIVDVENVARRLRENARRPEAERRPVLEVVYLASREIRGSIVVATLIVMLVFLPLFFLSGVEGRLLQPLGAAYLLALFASLVVALTVTPALCAVPPPRRAPDPRGSRGAARRVAEARLRPAAAPAPAAAVVGRRHGGAAARGRARVRAAHGTRVPAGLQRGRARHQRGHAAGHQPGRVERHRRGHRAAPARRAGGGGHRAPDRPRGTGRARAGRRVVRDRRAARSRKDGRGRSSWPRSGSGCPWCPAPTSPSASPSRTASTT